MMRRMLGAPLGGTIRGGQYGVESRALSLITPPNFSGGAGSCSPLMVVVALGEPGVPVISWAGAGRATNIAAAAVSSDGEKVLIKWMASFFIGCSFLCDCLGGAVL